MNTEKVSSIIDVVGDEHSQMILEETIKEPMSAEELSEICGVSPQTVYRRLEELNEHDLVEEEVKLDDDGHHYRIYRATMDSVTLELNDDGLEVEVSRRSRMAERFTDFVNEVREQ
jgi:DNA-binding transcriptional ArsR family regulator